MDDDNIEALREILQDMAQTIELISSGARSGNDLIFFLEEMLQTIESWAMKYNVVVDDTKPAEVSGNVNADFANQSLDKIQTKGEILPKSPHREPIPSGEVFKTPDQKGKTQVSLGRGGRRRPSRKKAGTKTPKASTKSPKGGSTKTPKASTKSHKVRTKSPNASSKIPKSGAKISKRKALKEHAKPSESADVADTDAGADADQSLALCVREEKDVEEMASPVATSSQPSARKIEVVESPNWLPPGWITEMKTRGTGSSAGAKDKYFLDPVSQRRFRSRREVFAFIERGSKHDTARGSSKTEPAKQLEEGSDKSPTEQTNETSQEKNTGGTLNNLVKSNVEHAASQLVSDTSTQPVVTSSVPSGTIIPHQPGQPSEWLLYESLANLPYPMYEQMRIMDNANKGDADNATLAPWPWLFGNTEGLKRPFIDNKPDDSKATVSVGETKETEPVAKRPKKTARKNAS